MPETAPRAVRRREFFCRLAEAPPAANHDEARALIDSTLNEVEDELSGVPFNPATYRTDGRMYPVQDDRAFAVDDHPRVTGYQSFGHETFIAENGAFEIRHRRTGEVQLAKVGADGQGVWS